MWWNEGRRGVVGVGSGRWGSGRVMCNEGRSGWDRGKGR